MRNKKWSPILLSSVLSIFAVAALAASANASGPHFNVLYQFIVNSDGRYPNAALLADKAGNLYGTTGAGGSNFAGTVYELSPPTTAGGAWTERVIYAFAGGLSGPDGDTPIGKLAMDSKGNLYGVTSRGGKDHGFGVVYELTHNPDNSWTESILYSFTGGLDGSLPVDLVLDASGNIYGVTLEGGTRTNCGNGCGVVFELTPAAGGGWNEQVLHNFDQNATGVNPYTVVIRDGKLYGTTDFSTVQVGTVFELAHQNGTWNFSVLYSFQGAADTYGTRVPLIFDASGNIFGVAGGHD